MAPRPKGMGDRTRISEDDYQALRQGSAGEFITGRSADGVPIFTPERLAFHDRIVDDILENLPRSQAPRMDMLGGGPATGKSSQIAEIFLKDRRRTSAMIDPDNIKTRMPNYRAMVRESDDTAAAFFHEESSYLAKRVQQAAIERRVDMIYDGTGDGSPESLARKIAAARENGYSVNGWYATIDIEEALARAAARAARTGREVPEDTIRATHAAVSRIFPTAVDEFDEIRLYDTTVRGKPSLIAEGGGGRLNVVDSDGYESFLAKGLD
jgi:predicted ABC-type ATPase